MLIERRQHSDTFALIFQCAFNPDATVGSATLGIIAAISQGAKRGLFSTGRHGLHSARSRAR
ncbi:MAG: alanine:cation symporter family protein [Eggerthella lenta]